MPRISAALGALLLLLASSPALAWAELGHRLVGALAQAQLTPEANLMVAEILRGEADPTLAGVAMWADDLRGADPERYRATSPWHYVSPPRGTCQVVPERDCRNGACVVGAIRAQREILADSSQPADKRRDALKFIVHFVGDVHQPLHANNRPDRGGNGFQISLTTDIPPEAYARANFRNGIMGTNLHAVWDYYVLASAGWDLEAYAERLMPPAEPLPLSDEHAGPEAWAAESCSLIDEWALYPKAHKMDGTYLARMRPHAERRIQLAARRLASVLNEAFASSEPDTKKP